MSGDTKIKTGDARIIAVVKRDIDRRGPIYQAIISTLAKASGPRIPMSGSGSRRLLYLPGKGD